MTGFVAPLNKGLSPQETGGRQSGFLEGPFRAAPERQRGFRKETEQRRCRRSEAEPHAPVTGGRQSGFPEGPFRAAPERQRGFRKETEQRRCRSAGAGVAKRSRMPHRGRHRQVTGGRQSGFPEEIPLTSVRRIPVINDKILIFGIILLNINSSD